MGAFAEAAAVIEKLDDRDVAVWIAADPAVVVIEDRLGIVRHQRHLGLSGFFCAPLFEDRDDFEEDIRVFQQIVAHLRAKGLFFGR